MNSVTTVNKTINNVFCLLAQLSAAAFATDTDVDAVNTVQYPNTTIEPGSDEDIYLCASTGIHVDDQQHCNCQEHCNKFLNFERPVVTEDGDGDVNASSSKEVTEDEETPRAKRMLDFKSSVNDGGAQSSKRRKPETCTPHVGLDGRAIDGDINNPVLPPPTGPPPSLIANGDDKSLPVLHGSQLKELMDEPNVVLLSRNTFTDDGKWPLSQEWLNVFFCFESDVRRGARWMKVDNHRYMMLVLGVKTTGEVVAALVNGKTIFDGCEVPVNIQTTMATMNTAYAGEKANKNAFQIRSCCAVEGCKRSFTPPKQRGMSNNVRTTRHNGSIYCFECSQQNDHVEGHVDTLHKLHLKFHRNLRASVLRGSSIVCSI